MENTELKIGDEVRVYPGPGEVPYDAIVTAIDYVTGIITHVKKTEDKQEKWVEVSKNVVLLVNPFIRIVRWIRSWFKKSK